MDESIDPIEDAILRLKNGKASEETLAQQGPRSHGHESVVTGTSHGGHGPRLEAACYAQAAC